MLQLTKKLFAALAAVAIIGFASSPLPAQQTSAASSESMKLPGGTVTVMRVANEVSLTVADETGSKIFIVSVSLAVAREWGLGAVRLSPAGGGHPSAQHRLSAESGPAVVITRTKETLGHSYTLGATDASGSTRLSLPIEPNSVHRLGLMVYNASM